LESYIIVVVVVVVVGIVLFGFLDMKTAEDDGVVHVEQGLGETTSLGKDDILQLEHTDPVLNAKMHLVNDAIDEVSGIGFGGLGGCRCRWQYCVSVQLDVQQVFFFA
jgi:hypothetical protein